MIDSPTLSASLQTKAAAPLRWGVVGGGILGMTLALRLKRQGHEVTLFEAGNHLGGLADAWSLGDVVWDRHYHVILLSDTYLRSLLGELGLEQELKWVETKTGFYTDGKLYSLSNTLEFLRFPPLRLLDKLRLGATIFYASKIKSWRRLESISAADWLRRWSGRRTCERIWLPLLRAKLGENYSKASAAFIWAIIARMYAARRTGLKKEMFGYVQGGYARILGRFSEVLDEDNVTVRLGQPIRQISACDAGVNLEFALGRSERFDRVVATTPAPVAAQLCPGLSAPEKARLRAIQYQGIICASVLLKQPLGPYYVTNITDRGLPYTAVIEMSALVERSAFGGNALVYLPKYVAPDDPAFALTDQQIEQQFLDGLARMYPQFQRSDVLCMRISRVRHVFALSTLHYSANVPSHETSVPGLFLVNGAQILNGTLNVNETVQLAEHALGRLTQPATQEAALPILSA